VNDYDNDYDIASIEQHVLAVLSSDRFLRMEGLGNEVPFFIWPVRLICCEGVEAVDAAPGLWWAWRFRRLIHGGCRHGCQWWRGTATVCM